MSLTRIKLERFAAFKALDLELSPGINAFVGANGTGKTHLLKIAYSACDVSKTGGSFSGKLVGTFLPFGQSLGRLVYRVRKSTTGSVEVYRGRLRLRLQFSNHAKSGSNARISGKDEWTAAPLESAYIPVKEMLANAPKFRALYAARDIHFEEVYSDIVDRAFRPLLRGPHDVPRKRLLEILQGVIQGKVINKGETFFLRNRDGELEFTLLAEGMRKLALLWLLIQNGTLLDGAVLFWDEPETNLNPRMIRPLVQVLLELQRMGVQILLATHDYVLLKELNLQAVAGDRVAFHALFRDETGAIRHESATDYLQIHTNCIADTFSDLFSREIARSLGGGADGQS